MLWLRGIGGVVAGYVFAAYANMGWVLWWYFGDRTMHIGLLGILTIAMFAASGWVGGALLKLIAGPTTRIAGNVATALIVLAGAVNLGMGVAAEPAWHTLMAILVQAPVLLLAARISWGTPP